MLLIVGVLYGVLVVRCAPTPSNESTYLLATVLFYKDVNGQMVLASGPVPKTADIAVRDDITSRINEANIKVVPVFNDSDNIPKSLDVLSFVKGEYKTVFVAEAEPKRLSRSLIDEIWFHISNGFLGNARKINMDPIYLRAGRVKFLIGNSVLPKKAKNKKYPRTLTTETVTTNTHTTKSHTTKTIKDISTMIKIEETTTTTAKTTTTDKRSRDDFVDFIPNDIYYSIEKKCVNWADGCNRASNVMNMSSRYFKYVYKRPRIVDFM